MDLKDIGFPSSITKVKLIELLAEKYPTVQWETSYILRGKFAQQHRLEQRVKALFPVCSLFICVTKLCPQLIICVALNLMQDEEIKINARREADIINPESGQYLELDIWIPSRNLAFEYQVCI